MNIAAMRSESNTESRECAVRYVLGETDVCVSVRVLDRKFQREMCSPRLEQTKRTAPDIDKLSKQRF